ncbi:hypothetical protein LPJ56_000933 [Coemansia sp. RSA 2599]|nr:hypothetical protein LPJ56_000933 [Coemansia sp. RSA 2599]
MSAGSTQLAKLPAYQEFLEERPVNSAYTSANFSIDAEFVTENPLREQSKSALDFALSGPLKKVIETYPEESAADADFDADSDKERAESSTAAHASSPSMLPLPPLPLPSSDLLDCINKSIMQKEASAEQSGHSLINEHLNGSSLLALGVLLQEYCRYLL